MNAILDFDLVRPTEGMEFGYINQFTHRAIGFRGVEFNSSLETNSLYNKF